jgi:hypothetical protein
MINEIPEYGERRRFLMTAEEIKRPNIEVCKKCGSKAREGKCLNEGKHAKKEQG